MFIFSQFCLLSGAYVHKILKNKKLFDDNTFHTPLHSYTLCKRLFFHYVFPLVENYVNYSRRSLLRVPIGRKLRPLFTSLFTTCSHWSKITSTIHVALYYVFPLVENYVNYSRRSLLRVPIGRKLRPLFTSLFSTN